MPFESYEEEAQRIKSKNERKQEEKDLAKEMAAERGITDLPERYTARQAARHKKELERQGLALPERYTAKQAERYRKNLDKQRELRKLRSNAARLKASGAKKSEQKSAAKAADVAQKLAKNATPWGLLSLFFQMNLFRDWMYGIALLFAILKDILNFIEVSGIGYALVVIATLLCSIFIAMMMLLGRMANGSVSQKQGKVILSWLILLGATIVELIPGVNFIPEETLAVIFIYILLLMDRKDAQQEQKAIA